MRHPIAPGSNEYDEFAARHRGHDVRLFTPDNLLDRVRDFVLGKRRGAFISGRYAAWRDNSNVKEAFGTSTAFTLTLASLGSGSARETTAIDNTSNLYDEAFVYTAVKVGTVAAPKLYNLFAYGSEDGTNYTDPATGSNAGITIGSPTNLDHLAPIFTPSNSGTYKSGGVAVAANAKKMAGALPRKWGMVVDNQTGAALDSTEGNHAYTYSGLYFTVA